MIDYCLKPEIEVLSKEITGRVYSHSKDYRPMENMINVPVNIDLYLNDCGLSVKYAKEENFQIDDSYFGSKYDLDKKTISLNPTLSKELQLFEIMFHLSHYYLRLPLHDLLRYDSSLSCVNHKSRTKEIFDLTLAFLMPKNTLITLWPLCNSLSDLAYKFNVSPIMVGIRLQALGVDHSSIPSR